MPCYFFSGKDYIKVSRGDTEAGAVALSYPAPISVWNWGTFGSNGIDATLYSGSKDYFFAGKEYIRVTRGDSGAGTMDAGYPKPISNWGWGSFGANGIDAALYSGSKCYFFAGKEYIRVTRDDTGAGSMDEGFPKLISEWGWGEFGANGIDAALNSGLNSEKDYFFSGDRYIRVTRGDTNPGMMDAGYPLPIWHWGWGEFGAKGIDAALFSGTDSVAGYPVTTPDAGLGSNSNYVLCGNCEALEDVTVTINVTEDIVTQSSSGALKGFGFQLNAYSSFYQKSAWQQYAIAMYGSELVAVVNNYPMTGSYLILHSLHLHTLPSETLPAGFQLKIMLQTGPEDKIVGAVYTVIDNHGNLLAHKTLTLTDIAGVTSADLAPIVAFELDLVGPANRERTVLSSGAGHIVYEAASPLTVLTDRPSCAESDHVTAEIANSVYGKLLSGPNAATSQTFGITEEHATVRKQGRMGPGMTIPRGDGATG